MNLGLVLGGKEPNLSYQLGVIDALTDRRLLKQIKYFCSTGNAVILGYLLSLRLTMKQIKQTIHQINQIKLDDKYQVFKPKGDQTDQRVELMIDLLRKLTIKAKKKEGVVSYIRTLSNLKNSQKINLIKSDIDCFKSIIINHEDDPLLIIEAIVKSGMHPSYFELSRTYQNASIEEPFPLCPLIGEGITNLIVGSIQRFDPSLYDHLQVNLILVHPQGETKGVTFPQPFIDFDHYRGYEDTIRLINQLKEQKLIKGIFKPTLFLTKGSLKVFE